MLTRLAQQAGLVEQDVIGLLRAYGRDVAGALPSGGKTSLAGVQGKIVLVLTESGWNRSATTAPQTHPRGASTSGRAPIAMIPGRHPWLHGRQVVVPNVACRARFGPPSP